MQTENGNLSFRTLQIHGECVHVLEMKLAGVNTFRSVRNIFMCVVRVLFSIHPLISQYVDNYFKGFLDKCHLYITFEIFATLLDIRMRTAFCQIVGYSNARPASKSIWVVDLATADSIYLIRSSLMRIGVLHNVYICIHILYTLYIYCITVSWIDQHSMYGCGFVLTDNLLERGLQNLDLSWRAQFHMCFLFHCGLVML